MTDYLYNKIKDYTNDKYLPFHTPGHKRVAQKDVPLPYDIDITEIEGFDNLHDMNGILEDACEESARFFGTLKTYFLINGSTGGVLSAIYSQTKCGDKIIVARNCHKSVFNAIELKHLKPIYVVPRFYSELNISFEIDPQDIEKLFEDNDGVKCVVITSPTYEGIVSDIKSIAEICHKNNAILIVDEAHGAHFGFDEHFPISAKKLGADIVINSLHKTLPALTQCAIMHICSDRVDLLSVQKALSMFETSSPSYILLSSIDYCVKYLRDNAETVFKNYYGNLKHFYELTKDMKCIKVLDFSSIQCGYDFDKGKIVVSTTDAFLSGDELADVLRREYKIEVEMASYNYVIAMTSICTSKDDFENLASALKEIDEVRHVAISLLSRFGKEFIKKNASTGKFKLPIKKYEICDAVERSGKLRDLKDCIGKASLEFVWTYPPGIPLVVPGEVVTEEIVAQILEFESNGIKVSSNNKEVPNKILVE